MDFSSSSSSFSLSLPSSYMIGSFLSIGIGALCLFDSIKPFYYTNSGLIPQSRKIGRLEDYPPPYPNGWFLLLYSFELPTNGMIKEVRALGKMFTIWRDETGKAHVFDNRCPHLGANLSEGSVHGCNLQCPFHGWTFNSDGKLVDIPDVTDISACSRVAKATVYESMEINDMILVWHSSSNSNSNNSNANTTTATTTTTNNNNSTNIDNPDESSTVKKYIIPRVPEISTMSFVGLVDHPSVRCMIQEIPENGADAHHLTCVHQSFVVPFLSSIFHHSWNFSWTPGSVDDDTKHLAVVKMELGLIFFGIRIEALTVYVHSLQVGCSLVQEILQLPLGLGKLVFASSVTPIKPLEQRMTHVMYCPSWMPKFIPKLILRGLINQVERDIRIWNRKSYSKTPPYSKLDANIPKFRKWFSQFYSTSSQSFKDVVSRERDQFMEW